VPFKLIRLSFLVLIRASPSSRLAFYRWSSQIKTLLILFYLTIKFKLDILFFHSSIFFCCSYWRYWVSFGCLKRRPPLNKWSCNTWSRKPLAWTPTIFRIAFFFLNHWEWCFKENWKPTVSSWLNWLSLHLLFLHFL
jgi:hypothetical protein